MSQKPSSKGSATRGCLHVPSCSVGNGRVSERFRRLSILQDKSKSDLQVEIDIGCALVLLVLQVALPRLCLLQRRSARGAASRMRQGAEQRAPNG